MNLQTSFDQINLTTESFSCQNRKMSEHNERARGLSLDKSFNHKDLMIEQEEDEVEDNLDDDMNNQNLLDNLLVEESNPQTESDKIRQVQMNQLKRAAEIRGVKGRGSEKLSQLQHEQFQMEMKFSQGSGVIAKQEHVVQNSRNNIQIVNKGQMKTEGNKMTEA